MALDAINTDSIMHGTELGIYGLLIPIPYSDCYQLARRDTPNGVFLGQQILETNDQGNDQNYLIKTEPDTQTDMFTVGRRDDAFVSFGERDELISRFAARICADRESRQVRIFAGCPNPADNGYVTLKNHIGDITNCNDGFLMNGLFICKSPENVQKGSILRSAKHWFEVSVRGNLFKFQQERNYTWDDKVETEDNLLIDGTIIELGTRRMMWRDGAVIKNCPDRNHHFEQIRNRLA